MLLSRVDVLLDRLAEFRAGGRSIVAQQVLVLLAGLSDDENAALDIRAPPAASPQSSPRCATSRHNSPPADVVAAVRRARARR